jgi:hypothetical protein
VADLTQTTDDLRFPARQDGVRATWAPIYIEPMVGSGERLTIGVAVANADNHLVVPVVSLPRLSCIYGKENEGLIFAAGKALDDMGVHLSSEGKSILETWVSPFEGLYKGPIRIGSGNSLEEIARNALMLCSSLVEKLEESEEEPDDAHGVMSESRLERLVKEKVLINMPRLENAFGREFKPEANVRKTNIGFVGEHLVANFSLLAPPYLARQVKDAKAKLWDLVQLQEYVHGAQFDLDPQLSRFELLINRISQDDPQYSDRQVESVQEAVNELEMEADKKEIRCRPLESPDAIAQVIVEAEAA